MLGKCQCCVSLFICVFTLLTTKKKEKKRQTRLHEDAPGIELT